MAEAPTRMPPPPPAPSGRDRRAAPRYEIVAQANVTSQDDVYVLTVRNLSAGGAFLEGERGEYPGLTTGVSVDIVLSCSLAGGSDDDVINIKCNAKITRVQSSTASLRGPGFGVAMTPASAQDAERLIKVLAALAKRSRPLP